MLKRFFVCALSLILLCFGAVTASAAGYDEIIDCISSLPDDITIDDEFVNDVDIIVTGCDNMVSDFIESNQDYDVDDWKERGKSKAGFDEIDLIFK